ncbi:MAG: hypothetical protein WCG97_02800 [bacterium]
MKTLQKSKNGLFSGFLALSAALIFTFGFSGTALASTPYLSISNSGNNLLQVNVTNADPNSAITLYYGQSSGSGVYAATLGTTNSSGYFSTTLNQSSYSIPQNSYVYVMVNGQSSSSVLWPYNNNNGNNYGNITLSQTSLNMSFNQSASVSIYGGNGSYYVSNNSNSGIASASVSGSSVNLYAYSAYGNTTITVCSYNNSGCATLYVYVQSNANNNQPTYVSPSTINLNIGQGQAVSISGSGSYNISSNSNPTAISALISGSVVNVYGSAPGSGTLNICSTTTGGCASLYVVVGNSYYNYNNGYNGYNNTNYNNGYNNGYAYNNTYYSNGYNNGNYNTYYNHQPGYVLGASTDTPYYSSVSSTRGSRSQVYLNQVPATGISFASLKTILFSVGLIIWSLFAAYIFMAKQRRRELRR